ncbi:glycosyltransferase family 2 protein [Granulibacter bethesdensis]|uniref:Alpha-L-Rha alpha-1,3-L-rhamnosyltransferase n=1 Tax=Granulibacter bethesdensis (strain ATCC BAA-1260 / CGDNIH1) TaxID=391165 RepID=Q0BVZ8_GRABC|nr:glycosyltransferase family 2 protein [Granulibacter bethesdensis]ABI61004.1 alpha-L-Rha alpha-1,3-L-rhamnosyltransferase [Granulibacter bethesdensis CGDNIH1]AHJ67091.1 alpha-L-Rha alpha-1,3-L-rhamnosyltransferase [Granulibacter bethesdensis]APH50774.1 alpha-L-Rha alpha-1,3-L-rhamnosyltransferase [Granulibacter bethesdensis]APH63469.1 alpha-L-Rha alpha-1,3-L-rhamnosyltransferase [Granulibacter bethesdensis]
MSTAEPPVAILLATYQGARYLPEQLDSLLEQTHRNWVLFWRDDGSTDATIAVMDSFAAKAGPERCHHAGGPSGLGACGSFLWLLRHAHAAMPEALLAFCDQDDVWLPQKLARAVARIQRLDPHMPGLYCARQRLVDSDLKLLSVSPPFDPGLEQTLSLPRALAQNVVTGCTAVLTPALGSLMLVRPPPEEGMHDWWAFILTAGCGGVFMADDEAVILYRQHQDNTVGAPSSTLVRAIAALRRGPRRFMTLFRQHLAVLAEMETCLTPSARNDLARMRHAMQGGPISRLRGWLIPGLRRHGLAESWLFRLWFLLG